MKLFFQTLLCLTALVGAHNSYASLAERKQAAIINAAVGDALGRITEFVDTTDKIHAQLGKNGITCMKQALMKHPQTGVTLAPYTDDTVMSLIVLEEALRAQKNSKPFDINKLAWNFGKLFSVKKYTIDPLYNIRAHGPTNMRSLKPVIDLVNNQEYLIENFESAGITFYRGLPAALAPRFDTTKWNQAEVSLEGGCGSVMRVWPLGLVFVDNIPLLIELADKQSQLTHRHPMARAASVAMAVGTAYALQDKSVDEIVVAMIEAAQKFDAEEKLYKTDALLTSELIKYAYEAARNGITPDKVLGTHNKMKANKRRSTEGFLLGWAADEAVAAAVYIFVRQSNNPQQAIIEGVNTPGDSDSIASLAGALVGAKTGKVFVDKDISLLENYSYLKQLANQI